MVHQDMARMLVVVLILDTNGFSSYQWKSLSHEFICDDLNFYKFMQDYEIEEYQTVILSE